jgi:hypothetical protein
VPEAEWPVIIAEALAAARTITDANQQARALIALIPHLPADLVSDVLLPDVLAAARMITLPSEQARA